MVRIKTTAFSELNASELISYANQVVSKMTNNPTYAEPDPQLSVITTQIGDLVIKNTAASGGDHTAILNRNTSASILVSLLVEESNYVVFVVGNAPNAKALIESAGFEMIAEKHSFGVLPAPQDVRTRSLSRAIEVRWKVVPGAKSYQVMKTTGDPNNANTPWVIECVCTRATVTIQNQVPGQQVAFKVYALGAAGLGEPSDFASGMALM